MPNQYLRSALRALVLLVGFSSAALAAAKETPLKDTYVAANGIRLTIKRIPDGSHWVIHEKPAEVNSYIRAFIGQH